MAETPPRKTLLPSWISNANAFFQTPNPKIFQLFLTSSFATFSLGVAMIIEWFYHGRHHPGFRWIIYYASSVVGLPIVMLIICLVSARIFMKRGEDKHGLPIVDGSDSEQSWKTKTPNPKRLEIMDGEVLFEMADISSDDEEAVLVQVGGGGRTGKYVNMGLRRSLSCQIFNACPDKKRKTMRRMSI